MEDKENLSKIAHIVYASDNRFAEILGISILSLYKNSQDMDRIFVYILDSGINDENKKRIEELSKIFNRDKPQWIMARDISQELQMKVVADRGSVAQYARLFVSHDLPQGLKRVLYLDSDILVVKSIYELWNLNMHGKTIAALNDAFSRFYRRNIGLDQSDVMFNSGVMLIDLARWNKQNIEQKLLNFIGQKRGKIQQGDQGALNAVLSRDCYCFDPKYNTVTIFYDFSYKELKTYRKPIKGYYSETDIKRVINDPYIIHFTTSFLSKRPWMIGCKHRYCNVWLNYKNDSPWRDEPLREDNRPKWKLNLTKIFKLLPRGLAIHVAGFFQAYERPLANKIKGF